MIQTLLQLTIDQSIPGLREYAISAVGHLEGALQMPHEVSHSFSPALGAMAEILYGQGPAPWIQLLLESFHCCSECAALTGYQGFHSWKARP